MTESRAQRPWRSLLVAALVVAGCASEGSTGDGSTTPTTGTDPTSASSGDWGPDLDGEALCGAAATGDVESEVGIPLAAEPDPVDSQGSAACIFEFEGGAMAEANASPAEAWEGRSPSEAYARGYEVNASPGGTTVTDLDDVGTQAALFVTEGIDAVVVLVQTDDRVFFVVTSDLTEEQTTDLARVLAASL